MPYLISYLASKHRLHGPAWHYTWDTQTRLVGRGKDGVGTAPRSQEQARAFPRLRPATAPLNDRQGIHRAPAFHSTLQSSKQLGRIKVSKCRGLSLPSPPTQKLKPDPEPWHCRGTRRTCRSVARPPSHVTRTSDPALCEAPGAAPRPQPLFCRPLSTLWSENRTASPGKQQRSLLKRACLSATLNFNKF